MITVFEAATLETSFRLILCLTGIGFLFLEVSSFLAPTANGLAANHQFLHRRDTEHDRHGNQSNNESGEVFFYEVHIFRFDCFTVFRETFKTRLPGRGSQEVHRPTKSKATALAAT